MTQKFNIDWLWVASLALFSAMMFLPYAHAQTVNGGLQFQHGLSNAASQAGAAANSASGTSTNTFNSVIPADTRADIKNVPGMGGLAGWAYAAPAGPCLGPSETKAGGIQGVWMGGGIGGNYGQGQSNLDWGCVILREMAAADSLCKAKVQKACTDMDKLYEMLPGISAIRAATMPEYAKQQVVPAPKPQPRADGAQPVRTAAIQQPTNCVSDEFIARRTGASLCKP